MVEESAQEKQSEGQDADGQEQEPKKKVSPVRRISMAVSDIYGLVKNPKKGDGLAAPQGEVKPDTELKKSVPVLPAAFNPQKINLKAVNQALVFVLIVLVGAMFYVTFRKGPSIASVTAAVSKIKFLDFQTKEIMAFQKVDDYMEQIRTRDIFSAYQEKKVAEPEVEIKEDVPPPPPPKPKVPIEQKAKNYKLMGISWGDSPKAMIRDISTQEVHFLSVGEVIKDTELTIEKVLKDEVIISSEGEEMSLL